MCFSIEINAYFIGIKTNAAFIQIFVSFECFYIKSKTLTNNNFCIDMNIKVFRIKSYDI